MRGTNFFLERDDRLGPLQLPLEPAVLPLELLHPWIERLRPALARTPGDELTLLALVTPRGQMRRVQAFAAQQRPHLAEASCTRRPASRSAADTRP